MTASGVTAVVLAGGRSSRFGADKLVADAAGRSVLQRAVDAVAAVAEEVIVVVAAGGRAALDPPAGPALRLVQDAEADRGPLAALRDGAAAAGGELLLVVAGDMPALHPGVLHALVEGLRAGSADAAILSPAPAPAPAAPLQTLPLALRRGPALDAATRLLAADRRSLRALLDELPTTAIPAATWRALDPEGATLQDIDTPEDLAAFLEATGRDQAPDAASTVESRPARSSSP